MQTYFLICLIAFFAGFTQGLSGFGSVLLSLPLLAIFLHIKIVIPLAALFGLSMTVILLIQLRRNLEWKEVYPLLIGALPGVPFGVLFLKRMDKEIIQLALGIILVSYSIYSLVFKLSHRWTKMGWAYLFGFLGGCLGGALSASGPPVIVYTSSQSWGKDKTKVILQEVFLFSGIAVVFFQVISGLTTLRVLHFYGVALPWLIFGSYVGSLLYGIMREECYRKVMLILLASMGGFMIWHAQI
ncbi:MAG: hypothetical protein DRG71_00065 [Deltaproteobacteria bacterium]|nr:MAG: hypothetical protein DRG71_00065 [Deltaproteobacteria bacterium]